MKCIDVRLPRNIDQLELHLFADEHIGDDNCDIPRLKERIQKVKDNPNAYCILNGDIMDFTSRSSIGDVEARELNIMEQVQTVIDLFEPIKDKIICITNGNHEERGYRKEGLDITRLIAMQLDKGDQYAANGAVLFLRFGKGKDAQWRGGKKQYEGQLYTIYVQHGRGGGRKEGAKAIRLADMACVVDADIYIHSHTHLPMTLKEGYYRVDRRHNKATQVTKLFVNTASNLNYGGYGQAQGYKPNSKDTPTIYLNGNKREMFAML